MPTPLQQANSRIVTMAGGGSLDEVVTRLRAEGFGWRRISKHLYETYGVNLDHVTLHRWYQT